MEGENFVPLPNILLNKASHIDLHAPIPTIKVDQLRENTGILLKLV